MRNRLIAIALIAASAPAQEQLGPRSFFPTNYEAEYFVDLEALRDNEFWEGVERSIPLRPLLAKIEDWGKFDLDDVERMRGASTWSYDADDETAYSRSLAPSVLVFEGAEALALPDDPDDMEELELSGHRVLRQTSSALPILWVSPQPGVRVFGPEFHVAAILEGRQTGGVPHPELLAMTAGQQPLAYFAVGRMDKSVEEWQRGLPFPAAWLDLDDPLELLMLRLEAGDEETIALSAVLRFADGEKGPALFEKELRAALAMAESQPQLATLKSLWANLSCEQSDRDLTLTIDLGPARSAATRLSTSLMPLMAVATAGSEPIVVEHALPPAPEPPEKKR